MPAVRQARLTWLALLLVSLALLAACGPGEPAQPSSADNTATTAAIARTFAADGNLTQASAALADLSVANERQWLVLVTEQAIGGAQDAETTAALVKLAVALNLESTAIRTYAAQNGLQPTPALVEAAAPTATTAPPTATSAAAPTPEPIVIPSPSAVSTAVALALPTATAADNVAPRSAAAVKASTAINVRSGPGLDYPVVDLLQANTASTILGKNAAGDWWEIELASGRGWVYAQLVTTEGDVQTVAVAANIPTPPPTAEPPTPAPIAAAAIEAPTEAAAATEAPTTAAADPNAQPYFRLVASRMWSKEENGACSGQHLLRINVIDANGVRINGVRLQGIYTGEVLVTGSQGKGDGVIEYDLYGTGEGFRVTQNDDGRPASSDNAEGFTTKSLDISVPVLIAGGYCTDEADCQIFYNSYGCTGHHSWEATFQRNY